MKDILITVPREGVYRFNPNTPDGTHFLVRYTTVQEWNRGIEVEVDRCAELCADAHLEGIEVG